MAGEWEETTLGGVSSDVAYGYTESASDEKVGPRFLRITDIQNGVVNWSTVPYCPISKSDHSKYRLQSGDIVVARTGNSTGENFLFRGAEDAVFASYLIRFRVNELKADPAFVWYNLRSKRWWNFINSSKTGSAQAGANAKVLGHFPLVLPPLAEQKAIAAVLGALDDKIELNRRMNATLEGIARALFQSWFIDFDPVRRNMDRNQPSTRPSGHPSPSGRRDGDEGASGLLNSPATDAIFPDSFQDSPLGPIPHGWRATTLGEVIEISDSKRIPLSGREREARQGKYPYHGAASVMDYVDDFLFDGIYLLMGEDGSVINDDGTPVLQYVWGKFWVNNHAHVLRGKNGISTEHLFLHLKGSNIAPFVNGAVQPKLNQGNMNRIPFILPPPEIGNVFAKAIEPLFAQIRANTNQSRTLATLRDTLLPKLLSGELRVTEAEKEVSV
jgi:type I restriction enzyme S subunit